MTKINNILRYGAAVLLLLLAGCSTLMTKPERPEVSIASINLVDTSLLEQRYHLQLRVQNPNDFDLPIDGIQMQLELNNQPFVTAVSSSAVTVPRFGTALVEIDAVSTLAGLLKQLKGVAASKAESVSYRLAGKVHLSQPAMALPFTQEGEINLSGVLPK